MAMGGPVGDSVWPLSPANRPSGFEGVILHSDTRRALPKAGVRRARGRHWLWATLSLFFFVITLNDSPLGAFL